MTAACNTVTAAGPSATFTQINSALSSALANTYILLAAGTYNLAGGLVFKSDVVLRGMGADQTFLVFSNTNSCIGAFAVVCMAGGNSSDYYGDAKMQPGGTNAATWTSGYAKGTTSIVLNSIGSNGISVGKWIILDQANDTATNSGYFDCETTSASPPCSAEGGAGDPGRIVGGIARQVTEVVQVTACSPSCTNGSTFTISPGVYVPNIAGGKSPGAWWSSSTIQNAGVENLSVDSTGAGGTTGIEIFNGINVWVTGTRQVRTCNCDRAIIALNGAAHVTIRNNYVYGTTGHSQNYGVEILLGTDTLIENNIFQHVVTPVLQHGSTGTVLGYNYDINNSYDDGGLPIYHYLIGFTGGHSAERQSLHEGNISPQLAGDVVHGTNMMNTAFRNYSLGSDPTRIDNTFAMEFESYARYWNLVANVLGTPGFTANYVSPKPAIYVLGGGRGIVADDALLAGTMMRWGNYDTVNAATLYCTANGVPIGACTSDERGQTAPTYPALVSPSSTFPASFYYASKPAWWPVTKPWPSIGPDVTGGTLTSGTGGGANLGGHANSIPARDCYLNVMGGPVDGSGSPLSFNSDNCYVVVAQSPSVNVQGQIKMSGTVILK